MPSVPTSEEAQQRFSANPALSIHCIQAARFMSLSDLELFISADDWLMGVSEQVLSSFETETGREAF